MRTGILLLLLLIFISGCSMLPVKKDTPEPAADMLPETPPQRQPNVRETILYLPEQTRRYLLPLRVYIPWETGIAKAAIKYCTEGSLLPEAATDFAPLLPAGTSVLGLSLREGVARVDFSKEFLNYPAEQEQQIINGLIYTLTEFPTIDAVEIFCEGQQLQLSDNKAAAAPYTRQFGLNPETAAGDFAAAQFVTLYFLHEVGDRTFFVPVTRVVEKTGELLTVIAEELLRGPQQGETLFTAIPNGLSVEEITAEGNRVVLRLSGELPAGITQLAADRLRQQLALTFTEIHGITEVTVLINNRPPDFGAEVSFPPAFGRPKQWNLVQ
jgi:germination protein M